MEYFTKPEIAQGYNWFCNVQPQPNDTDKIMDISPFDDFIGLDWASQFSYQSNQLYTNGFNLPNLDQSSFEVDQNPLNVVLPDKGKSGFVEASVKTGNQFASEGENQELPLLPLPSSSSSTNITRKRSSSLQFDDIRKHFDVPLTMAAKKMNVSVTLLKKRCRELKITRWPHRKLRSLNVLINSLKEKGLTREVAMLEKQKKMLEKLPGMDLNEEIKKLRQACFKDKSKKRSLIGLNP